ncbi:MAG: HEAT repeat domain-containing protein, partial [Candidatus Omnitrophica bacterium]|nr:HEAT repeat domain-containing protein [Candidatus Omnitrophota bacterium]
MSFSLPFRTHKAFLRIVSFFLAVAFLGSDFVYASPVNLSRVLESPYSKEALLENPYSFETPLDFAVLKDVRKGETNTLILHIQDPHSNLSGQENLSRTLDFIFSKYPVSLILVEGSSKDATLDPLKRLASQDKIKKAAKNFLIQGKLHGEEYLNLTSQRPIKIRGIEDKALYQEGLKHYAALLHQREAILGYLKRIQAVVEKLKTRDYPRELLEYEGKVRGKRGEARGKDEVQQKELLRLAKEGNVPLQGFGNLKKLEGLQEKEKEIDFGLVSLEFQALSSKPPMPLRHRALADRPLSGGSFSSYAHIQNTLNIARKKNISLSHYPQKVRKNSFRPFVTPAMFKRGSFTEGPLHERFPLKHCGNDRGRLRVNFFTCSHLLQYRDYLEDFSKIDFEGLLRESEKLERMVYNARLKTQDARRIRAIDQHIKLLLKAHEVEMTSEDFRLFEAQKRHFPTFAYLGFLNRRLAELGYFQDIVPYEDFLEKGRASLEAFYRSVSKRDLAFLWNTERILKEENQQIAILITGGYHTDHLKKLFQEKGYSYVVLTPLVTKETSKEKYEKRLLEPIEKKVKGQGSRVKGEERMNSSPLVGEVRRGGRASQIHPPLTPPIKGGEHGGAEGKGTARAMGLVMQASERVPDFAQTAGVKDGRLVRAVVEELERRPDNPDFSERGARLAKGTQLLGTDHESAEPANEHAVKKRFDPLASIEHHGYYHQDDQRPLELIRFFGLRAKTNPSGARMGRETQFLGTDPESAQGARLAASSENSELENKIQALTQALKNEDRDVRSSAVWALGRIAPKATPQDLTLSIPALIHALKDEDS